MELGEKLRQARLEAGLSQRQLCGDIITRNMLSQIENGSASPSMKTLQALCSVLGKPVSYFLEEDALLSPNQPRMEAARRLYDAGQYGPALETLATYQAPDPVFDREKQLLSALLHLELAQQAIADGKTVQARELLNKIELEGCYCAKALHRQRLLLLGQLQSVSRFLPSLDEELLLRAKEALAESCHQRAAALLDACEDPKGPHWNFLRGQAYLAQNAYAEAAQCLHQAEDAYPKETLPKLEICYRELGDYRRAYEYACRQK